MRVSEVARAVHDVFYNFSRIGREQMLSIVSLLYHGVVILTMHRLANTGC